jgi:hypothetical protein
VTDSRPLAYPPFDDDETASIHLVHHHLAVRGAKTGWLELGGAVRGVYACSPYIFVRPYCFWRKLLSHLTMPW